MTGPVDWEAALQVPGALGAILQGLFASEDRDNARRFRNSRVASPERTIADVHDALHPIYSDRPFAESIQPLLKPSLRAIAERAGLDHTNLRHLIAGTRPLSKYKLESLARACRVSPGYFLEYRQMVVSEVVAKQVAESHAAGIAAFLKASALV